MSLLPEVRRLSAEYGVTASRALSQNFLIDERVLEREAARVEPKGKVVLEVGPGLGFLTRLLARGGAKRVVAVEKDDRLIPLLEDELGGFPNVELVHADFLEWPGAREEWGAVASNVPYSISSPFLFTLAGMRFSSAVICLQKEFVARMRALPGSPEYSRLSLAAQAAFALGRTERVPRSAFHPAPAVDSTIISLSPTGSPLDAHESRLATLLFQHKKKTVRAALADSAEALGIAKDAARSAAEASGLCARRVFSLARPDLNRIALQIARA